ncbi:MAG: DUF937 domain-containing protein [Firmicutes bacterium]|nr:DUF937 domain-containing protein [Bacillota bacterium]
MNLFDLLSQSMMSNQSVDALSQKTGESPVQIKKLLAIAIPLLILYMTKNASSKEGAGSLAQALTQHKETGAVDQQIAKSDEADGEKILGHIFGNNTQNVMGGLAQNSGMNIGSVVKILAILAPILLSGLSAATNHASNNAVAAPSGGFNLSDGLDLGDIFSLFGGAAKPQQAPQQAGFNMDLLGSLLGGNSKPQQSGIDGSALINALLSVMK